MVIYKYGDIFTSNAQVLTNPINCVGVMGKGLAKEFKNKYPDVFNDYKLKCDNKEVKPGNPYLVHGTPHILMFPTKDHWKDPSRLEWISNGLKLTKTICDRNYISTLALTYLGCGCGGLNKNIVEEYILYTFNNDDTITVELWDLK